MSLATYLMHYNIIFPSNISILFEYISYAVSSARMLEMPTLTSFNRLGFT